ncbi:MAG: TonB-dependent receptor [Betaproteobacteria bacterium]|nr:TonB-dependent receptor [Betaproteobacteria bacterium]
MPWRVTLRRIGISSYFVLAGLAGAHETTELSAVEIRARAGNLEGLATAGSEGVVSGQRLEAVPLLRPGEALEMVPGLIVTQHAGDGKANQYFLRGFNLDHGTDFATWVAGVPVNMPTHAHGQGYTDLNFLIPELVDRIRYRKGPYYADEGDFSSVGVARIDYRRYLDGTLAQLTAGRNGYARALLAGSPDAGPGHLLYALEFFHNDGPWEVPENYRKLNGVLRYSQGSAEDGFALTGMAYRGQWTSTDQVARRAIDGGRVGRYGTLDDSTGGDAFRYSLAAEWARRGDNSQSRASAWWLRSGLDLWSNFQYCLNDYAATGTCATGDQFKQGERRQAGGFSLAHTLFDRWGEFEVANAFGVDARVDRIDPVTLDNTQRRITWNTVRADAVTQRSVSLWAQNETRWTDWFRSQLGLRGDAYDFTVDASLPANSGKASDHVVTPKLALIFGPWQRTELYANYGQGFHSNDARGTTIRVDPADGVTPVSRVSPLVRTTGYEIGLRSEPLAGWKTTLAVWQLNLDSELLFVGDAGTTEPSRPSRRCGAEWTNTWVANAWLAFDADLAWSHARFSESAPEGDYIPGAIVATANLGVTVDNLGPWFGALRLRYFGPRPLVEDNSVRSQSSALTNLRIGYKFTPKVRLALDVYNLFNRQANDIEYWYQSQLPGEAAPAFDRHIHPTEPRSARLTLAYRF